MTPKVGAKPAEVETGRGKRWNAATGFRAKMWAAYLSHCVTGATKVTVSEALLKIRIVTVDLRDRFET